MNLRDLMSEYEMQLGANISMCDNNFSIEVFDNFKDLEKCVYIIIVGNEIVRIGNTKNKFYQRMRRYELDISKKLEGKKSNTPEWEATSWKERIQKHKQGFVYVRKGWQVKTPVGEFNAYMDEESVLIGRHLPPLNRSKHR